MRRQICWTERLEDGVKRETRVTFLSDDRIKWQFKRADEERWDYDRGPTADEWAELEQLVENRYRRRTATLLDLELTRRLRREAGA